MKTLVRKFIERYGIDEYYEIENLVFNDIGVLPKSLIWRYLMDDAIKNKDVISVVEFLNENGIIINDDTYSFEDLKNVIITECNFIKKSNIEIKKLFEKKFSLYEKEEEELQVQYNNSCIYYSSNNFIVWVNYNELVILILNSYYSLSVDVSHHRLKASDTVILNCCENEILPKRIINIFSFFLDVFLEYRMQRRYSKINNSLRSTNKLTIRTNSPFQYFFLFPYIKKIEHNLYSFERPRNMEIAKIFN